MNWILIAPIFSCDASEDDDCPSECTQPQSAVEWSTFFNYLDISDQIRLEEMTSSADEVDAANLIDHPQSDSTGDHFMAMSQKPVEWILSDSAKTSGTNLGRDIHWTPLLARIRRSVDDENEPSLKLEPHWTDQDQVELFCSNFLVNSTVAFECGQYLDGPYLMTAIAICVDGQKLQNIPSVTSVLRNSLWQIQMSPKMRIQAGQKNPWDCWKTDVKLKPLTGNRLQIGLLICSVDPSSHRPSSRHSTVLVVVPIKASACLTDASVAPASLAVIAA